MKLALVADVFPPLRSSGAVQLRDLSNELVSQGHEVTVLVASPLLDAPYQLEVLGGLKVLRLKTPATKDRGYVARTLGEFWMPFVMLQRLQHSSLSKEVWDAVVWYSPSIFLGPLVKAIKSKSCCPSYLIVRDIFPEWAADMGLMSRGLPFLFFKLIAAYQYSIADVIGIQSRGNAVYFKRWDESSNRRLEVLHNWLAPARDVGCTIDISQTALAGRKIFVYAGNMGVAQGTDVVVDLAQFFKNDRNVGFVLVGRGSEIDKLKSMVAQKALENVLFFEEIDPGEIPSLYAQCDVGLVLLDARHRSHNVPGKFLTYMQAGLPVLAAVNAGNDLIGLIDESQVGRACEATDLNKLFASAKELLAQIQSDNCYCQRCQALCERLFTAEAAARQVVASLKWAQN
jgi:glycosyltransferase involved in cell wall biosynthesis